MKLLMDPKINREFNTEESRLVVKIVTIVERLRNMSPLYDKIKGKTKCIQKSYGSFYCPEM